MRIDEAYKKLGVPMGCTDDELKTAYRRKMMANHPDRGGTATATSDIVAAKATVDAHRKQKGSPNPDMDVIRNWQNTILEHIRTQAARARQDLRRRQIEMEIRNLARSIRVLTMFFTPITVLVLLNGDITFKVFAAIILGLGISFMVLAGEIARVHVLSKNIK